MSQPTRAAVYIRVSTDRQASEGESLEMQEARAREVAESHGWELLPPYLDVMSGRKDKRPSLARLERDIKAGALEAVICYKVDRLGRSRRRMHELLEVIQQRGIRLVSLTQQIDTSTAAGRMMLSILIDLAVFEVEQSSERITDTLLHMAREGKPVSGTAAYGYRYEPKALQLGEDGREATVPGRYVIDEAEAAGVRLAFEAYLRLGSLAGAAKAINLAGYRTRGGRPWYPSHLCMLLINPIYGGQRAVRAWGKGQGGVRKASLKDFRDGMNTWEVLPGPHPAIVDPEVTAAARALYQRQRRTHPRSRRAGSPWSGLLRCGACGEAMRLIYPTHATAAYFRCPAATLGACDLPQVSSHWLDAEVIRVLSEALEAAGLVAQAAHKGPRKAGKAPTAPTGVAQRVAALKRALDRLEVRFDHEIIGAETYLAERKRIMGEIEAVQVEAAVPPPAPRVLLPVALAEAYRAIEGHPEAVDRRRRLLQSVIERVVIEPEAGRVYPVPALAAELDAVEVPRWPKWAMARHWSHRAQGTTGDCSECRVPGRPLKARGLCAACYMRARRAAQRGDGEG